MPIGPVEIPGLSKMRRLLQDIEVPATQDNPDWAIQYYDRLTAYDDLRDEVAEVLYSGFKDRLKTHEIVSRVKKLDSFIDKIERKGYTDPFGEMPDIVGARVVCMFLEDLKIADEILHELFDVHAKEDKSEGVDPELLRYQSVHYECMIKNSYSGPHYDGIKGIIFEIQVRTILQDAWAVIEHRLAYKGRESIPNELRRDFSALVGLFHVADKQFQQIRHHIEALEDEASDLIERHMKEGTFQAATDISIDRGTLKAFLRAEFPDRDRSKDYEYSSLVDSLAAIGIRSIGKLADRLRETMDQLLESEAIDRILDEDNDFAEVEMYSDVGFVYSFIRIKYPEFFESESEDQYEVTELDEDGSA
ncbi:GTP pyrophosphokinase family protein [Nocardia sp. NPDC127606]|uniref:GTP pyrophosphokinase n=1 Tax=Nocardia sp. NPDC127606 TaxID=3345406 RepID=UPI00363E560E